MDALFSSAPLDSVAYVIVQYLSSEHKSLLRDLLSRHTVLEIVEAQQNVPVVPNKVYIIPSDKELTIKNNHLELIEKTNAARSKTIDTFFKSLASDKKRRAIGIVLSGTGDDGAEGVRAIKKAGGMVLVQEPETAKFDAMPRNAINTGSADFVLPPELMHREVFNFVKVAPIADEMTEIVNSDTESTFFQILDLVHVRSGIDFSNYKRPTIIRRISRRIALTETGNLNNYLDDDLNNYFRSTNIGQIFVDQKLTVRKYTPAATQLINLIESDSGRSIFQISSNLRYEELIEDINSVIATTNTIQKEVQDKKGIWYQMRIMPYITQDCKIDGAIIFIQINELKNLHLLHLGILDSSPNAIMALEAVRNQANAITDFRLSIINHKAQVLFGRPESSLLGKSLWKAFPALLEQGMFERLVNVVTSGKMLDAEQQQLGNDQPIWLHIVAVKFNDGLVLTLQNIRERKQHEQNLKQQQEEIKVSAERFRTLLEAMPQISWTNNPDGTSSSLNKYWYEYTGLTPAESADWGWTKALHPDDVEQVLQVYMDSLKKGQVCNTQGRFLQSSDQKYRWHLIKDVPIRNDKDEITLWVGTATDIQNQKDAEEATIQLRLAQQREILKAILQTQETERDRISEALHNGLGQILYAAKLNLNNISSESPEVTEAKDSVDQLLSESITVTRNISFELTPSVLKEFGLRTALEEVISRITHPGLKITIDMEGCDERLDYTMELSLYRIIQELLNNILKHSHATEASIELTRDDSTVLLSVKDNGVGIDKEELKKPKGIGLHSIQNRVDLLEGKLEVASSKNKGTSFKINIQH